MTTEHNSSAPIDRRRHRLRVAIVAGVWTAMVIGFFTYQHASGTGPKATAQSLIDDARGNWWALIAYLAVSIVRPVVMFPATLVTVAAGMLFGPAVGIGVAVVAANMSAMVGYSLGRRVGRTPTNPSRPSALAGWIDRLCRNSFESVLIMRLLFLPYDVVNYGCGLIGVRRRQFLAATAIGSLPGTIAFVLVGASIKRLDHGVGGVDRATLWLSSGLIFASIVGSRLLRRSPYGSASTQGPVT